MAYTKVVRLAPVVRRGARSGLKMDGIWYVTIHMTDNWSRGAGALAHANYLQGSGKNTQASWHWCIDDTYATNSIPEDEIAWHAGDQQGPGNMHSIAIEICVNPESNLLKACDNGALLAADILKRHGLGIDKLRRHYDFSGKWCPSMMMDGKPYTWNVFKSKVESALNADILPPVEEGKGDEDTSSSIGIGSIVYFDGKSNCYSSSYGDGMGSVPPAGEYKVTHYEPGNLYSVHIGEYGWVPAANCSLTPGVDNEKPEEKPSESIKVGSTVYFDGKSACYATSAGTGKGMTPKAGNYKVTHYNPDAVMPIHIGSYGWVPAANCGVKSTVIKESFAVGKTVYFDGKSACYASSNGTGKGMTPKAGNYKITYYSKTAKMPIHIGSYGWVPAANCKIK